LLAANFGFLLRTLGWEKRSMADSGDYDKYAAQCIRQAQQTPAPETRAFLLTMAQAWLRLSDLVMKIEKLEPAAARVDGGKAASERC
jgi:hypothetical protein